MTQYGMVVLGRVENGRVVLGMVEFGNRALENEASGMRDMTRTVIFMVNMIALISGIYNF